MYSARASSAVLEMPEPVCPVAAPGCEHTERRLACLSAAPWYQGLVPEVICGAGVQNRGTEKSAFRCSRQGIYRGWYCSLGSEERPTLLSAGPSALSSASTKHRETLLYTHSHRKGFSSWQKPRCLPWWMVLLQTNPSYRPSIQHQGAADTIFWWVHRHCILSYVRISQVGTVHRQLQLVNHKHKVPSTRILGAASRGSWPGNFPQ